MAFLRFLSLITVTLSLFLTTSSRSVSTTCKTTVLDVASSLQRAQEILSIDPKTLPSLTSQPDFISRSDSIFLNSSTPLSLKLYSRDILFSKQHENYKSLVLSRLERDSVRVDEINSRIRIAVEGNDRSTLKPISQDDPGFQTKDLSTPVISGRSRARESSGEYFSRIGIGTPSKEMYMVLDTGSDVNWIQCEPCINCYEQSDPIFAPTKSSTYSSIACSNLLCKALPSHSCESNKCQYIVSYGDASSSTGDFVTDTVTFGESGRINDVGLGCGHNNQGIFFGAAGLLGLGGGAVSLTSQIRATSFSYCLVERDSPKASRLDFNSPLRSGDVTVPLLRNSLIDTYYYIGLSGISVAGELAPIPPWVFQIDSLGHGGVVMDSGTFVSRLPSHAYNSLRDTFIKHAKNLKQATSPIPFYDTCYDFLSLASVDVPAVTFHFTNGESLDLPADNFLTPIDYEPGIFCFAFAPTASSLSIFGNVQQQSIRFTFDLARNRIGLSPNQC